MIFAKSVDWDICGILDLWLKVSFWNWSELVKVVHGELKSSSIWNDCKEIDIWLRLEIEFLQLERIFKQTLLLLWLVDILSLFM